MRIYDHAVYTLGEKRMLSSTERIVEISNPFFGVTEFSSLALYCDFRMQTTEFAKLMRIRFYEVRKERRKEGRKEGRKFLF